MVRFLIIAVILLTGSGPLHGTERENTARQTVYQITPRHSVALIPYPARIEWLKGKKRSFQSLKWEETGHPALTEIEAARQEWEHITKEQGIRPSNSSLTKDCLTVSIMRLPDDGWKPGNNEAYTLRIPVKGEIEIAAREFGGLFNALQTLRQLIVRTRSGWSLPCCTIQDAPAFPVRGVMLDLGRYYLSVPFIKELARNLSAYKINLLHLHLTDDPAWRVQIDKYPALTRPENHWPTRLPGKSYTKEELKEIVEFCRTLNMRVVPEIDMPGHSKSFEKAMGVGMQTPEGVKILKDIIDELIPIFPDPWFHMGSDEVPLKMKDFISQMTSHIEGKGKDVMSWYPGLVSGPNAIYMCWGENEAGHTLKKDARFIDSNGFYLDWMDAQSGVYQVFFQQPCEMPESDGNGLGSIMAVWCDGALKNEQRILEQYPFYPCALTFAERIWRGAKEKRKDLMARLPDKNTREGRDFSDFETRLVFHRDRFFKKQPFAYVKQADIQWKLIGPFPHDGQNDKSFGPEQKIEPSYAHQGKILSWLDTPAWGGAVHIRHLYSMFNAHRKQYNLDHWPTLMSPLVGKESGTCYALTYIRSPKEADVYLMFGLNGMWGHSGGYRTSRAPEQGSWDFSGGDIWLNDRRVDPPQWPFKSLPWTGWGTGRIENAPLTQEGYFFRPPVKIHLKKGLNKVLVKSVSGHWKGDSGECKWFFCCIPVNWDGLHYSEVDGLEYVLSDTDANKPRGE